MKTIQIPPIAEREKLMQTPTEVLVEIILRQQEIIQQLMEEVERLKTNASSDSRSSSKPPSSDILKIDIESAETVVFSQNYEKWLRKVQNIVIELHGEECEAIFFKAMSPYKYDLYTSGELTVCRNITLRE